MSDLPAERILDAICAEHWFITQEALDRMATIAMREHDVSPEMISRLARDRGEQSLVQRVGSTRVINVTGPMSRYADMFSAISGMTSTERVMSAFAAVDNDPEVDRIVMRFDTPGGAASGLDEAGELIRTSSTPTIAFATGMLCSAGYRLAVECDAIYAASDAIIGSIGVLAQAPRRPSESTVVSRHAPLKTGSRESVQAIADRLEEQFIAAVARGRGVTFEDVITRFGRGDVFVGQDAVSAGLIDGIATIDSVLSGRLVGEPPRRKAITKEVRMDTEQEKGGITAADHEREVKAARIEGHEAGKREAEASATVAREAAVTTENERLVAIMTAAEGKPLASVLPIARNQAIDAESAVEIIAGFPDAKRSGNLDAAMAGTNPDITNDSPTAHSDADKSGDIWATVRGEQH